MKLTSAIVVLASAVASVSAATYPRTVGQDLCCATNLMRAQAGLPALKWLPSMDAMAQAHSNYQRNIKSITHFENPGTSTYGLSDRLKTIGFVFSTAAENVGSGFSNVPDVTTAWMNSAGHKANILGKSSTVCGGAVANAGGYYTIDYASPMSSSDNNSYYTLQCNGEVSLGAYTGAEPLAHNAQSTTAAKPAPTTAKPAPPPAKTTAPPAKNTVVPPPIKPVSSAAPAQSTSAPVPPPIAPVVPVVPPPSNGGKCKLMPKGSIAAGKCKPCKNCGSKASPFRR
ncbi:hypothetical protein GGI04_000449 [Coemansia thaxteri]|uniref:SCP domain-containing protein n=1 Tax=Coemansia thaxteri TaxID=2663907 RepID=A0A9W8BDA4_9FUNG|nr:hypothetical protein H4R26_003108 [Coemansia thaxteri]KAJ2009422.1 hypothetical protein GGI04_000449 [Coemansia thaxteri]KAJ2473967.1 hypothetical protein GGI02_000485 [Coemansia sp. RSA 2322]KAJ2480969.1 hypothetical protein EV174_003585 [Coemansia sp. RSA 2320]